MVESESGSAHATVLIVKDNIYINGHGGEHSRKLKIR